MGRRLDRIIVLGGLVALAACIEVAPRSSLPFQGARDRHARYAAEVTLAIKEERRDEVAEAAANGRLVLPQMPEIWGVTHPELPDLIPPPALALLDRQHRARPQDTLARGCRGTPNGCDQPLQIAGLPAPLLLDAAIAPAAAPRGTNLGAAGSPYRFQLYFDLDSAELDAAAARVVESVAGSALMIRPVRVIVAGYADSSGTDAYNQRLALRRAAAVITALVAAGVPAELIETTPVGERAPAVLTEEGIPRRHDRRVEITLV
jgi:outer membrane protein OmpA-like peptidoglycan-associated protein